MAGAQVTLICGAMNLQCEPYKAMSWDEQMSEKESQNVKFERKNVKFIPKFVISIARCSVPHLRDSR